MKMWKAALYARLSRDDDNYGATSMSITNQIDFMKDWLEAHPDIDVIDVYTDDGYTGTNFERPGWQKMMSDISFELVDCIIVKDLSRLGRNTSRVGQLKDEFFPSHGIRFIAINDMVDTMGGIDNNDVTDFKLVFNEYYVKDISKKTKSAFRTLAKKGEYIGAYAPYGYRKSEEDYHKLVIDEYAAGIVRRIFSEYADYKSGRQIANDLNKDGVLTPMNYRNQLLGKELKDYAWTSNSVTQILSNDVYLGHMIQHKRENVSYKLKQRRTTNADERIVVYDTHEPIVDGELYDAVMKRRSENKQSRNRARKDGTKLPILYSGMLICTDCGNKLAATTKNGRRCYRCCRYNNSGDNACSSHFIYEDNLKEYVMSELKRLVYEYNKNHSEFIKRVLYKMNWELQQNATKAKVRMAELAPQIAKLEEDIIQSYKDKTDGVISNRMYEIISKSQNERLNEMLQTKKECDIIMKKSKADTNYVVSWINALVEVYNSNLVERKQLARVIDSIYIGNVSDSNRIKIIYKVGSLEEPSSKALAA